MTILLVGLNHQTAAVELRERLALGDDKLQDALREFNTLTHLVAPIDGGVPNEAVIVTTCNRFEIYLTADNSLNGWTAAEQFLLDRSGVSLEQLRPQVYYRSGREAVAHLMRVASGLDSLVLGESQIMTQVASAYSAARVGGTAGATLSQLFTRAIHTGKRARTETAINRHSISIGHVAALLLKAKLGELEQVRTLVVGAGTMAGLVANAFYRQNGRTIACINRTFSKAEALARQVGGHALPWEQLPAALVWADAIITATAVEQPLIRAAELAAALRSRDERPLFIVDIAVPRNVDPAVDALPQVQRYDVDALRAVVDTNLAQRQAAVPSVEALVQHEAEQFLTWLHTRQVTPVIADLRSKALGLANTEVQQTLRQLKQLDQRGCELVAQLAYRIINKLLHEPTMRLKDHAGDNTSASYVSVVRELFALEEAPAAQPLLALDGPPMERARMPREQQAGTRDG